MNILDLYKNIDQTQRFVDEVFLAETYKPVRPQLTIIDGGAYEGEFSYYCLPFAKVIYAFEPDPTPFAYMDNMIKKHGLGDVIKHSNLALAGYIGERYFHNSGYGGSTLSASNLIYQPQDEIRVKTTTLATVVKENNLEVVDILKLDMEDAETEVLAAPDFLEVADRVKMIIGEHLRASDNLLKSLGYKSYTHCENTIYTR